MRHSSLGETRADSEPPAPLRPALRVLLVSSNSGSRGGGEIYLDELSRGLLDCNCEVVMLLDAGGGMCELAERMHPDVEIRRLPLRPTYQRTTRSLGATMDFRFINGLSSELRRSGADIVHVNQQTAEDALDHLLAARRSGIPMISTIHIPHSPAEISARFGNLRAAVARRALGAGIEPIICVSMQSRQELLRWTGIDQRRVAAVSNGVASPRPRPGARDVIRQRNNITDDARVLLAVGRVEPQKSPMFLLRVLASTETDKPLHLIWVGDGSLRSMVEQKAAKAGIAGKITITGWVDDPADYYAAADIFVMPSSFEGLPLALLEAMHAGLPIVANRVDGICEAIENGLHGRLLPTGDLPQWAKAITQLAGDHEERRRLGGAAKARSSELFSRASMTDATLNLYREALGKALTAPAELSGSSIE